MITSPLVQAQHVQASLHQVVQGAHAVNFEQHTESLGLFNDDSLPTVPIMPSHVPVPGHIMVEASNFDVFGIPDNFTPDGLDVEKHDHPLVQGRKKPTRDEGVIKEIAEEIENTEPEWMQEVEDEVVDVIKPINKPLETIERGAEGAIDTVLDDVYPEAQDWLQNDHDFWQIVGYFRWIANFIFVGSPWFTFSIAMIIINLALNILLNQWWADGNGLLIFNTVYLIAQTILSWPLIFEIPIYINQLRFFRALSVLGAFGYTFVYAIIVIDWMWQIFWEPESTYENYGIFDIFINMFLAYNVASNLHIIPVNVMIILKEVSLWIFPPMLEQDTDEQLTTDDAKSTISPYSWDQLLKEKQLPDQQDAYKINRK